MSHLKQTLHNLYTRSFTSILTLKNDLQSRGVVPRNLVLAENLGILLSCLLSLLNLILQKLKLLWTLTELPGYNVRYTLCRWADAVKNIPSTLKTLPKRVWQKDGDLPQDYI